MGQACNLNSPAKEALFSSFALEKLYLSYLFSRCRRLVEVCLAHSVTHSMDAACQGSIPFL